MIVIYIIFLLLYNNDAITDNVRQIVPWIAAVWMTSVIMAVYDTLIAN